MSDIVERLDNMRVEVDHDALNAAIAEIKHLRAQLASIRQVAGAVSLESGLTFGEIKKEIRNGE